MIEMPPPTEDQRGYLGAIFNAPPFDPEAVIGGPKHDPDVTPLRQHNGGLSTDATDPEMVRALARRVIRPIRERAKALGYAIGVHGSLERDIDLIAVPWTDRAHPAEALANSLRQVLSKLYPIHLEVPPSAEHPRPHGRVCWSWWIRPWTYIDLSIYPTAPEAKREPITHAQGVAWFEQTFGVPLGDKPGLQDVTMVRAMIDAALKEPAKSPG